MDGTKKVLVQLGSYNRVVTVDDTSRSEREALISSIRVTFSDKIKDSDAIILQMKDEEWGGAFIDYFEDRVPDKSILRVIVEKPQVSICTVSESYTFKKGKSRSKRYGSWKDKVPTPKLPKFDREMRDNRVTELNEVIADLTRRIAIKESKCQQAEVARNYKLCDQLSEDIMELKSTKRQNEKELLFFKKKEKRSKRYQDVKRRKLSESPDTARATSRSRSATPGFVSTPLSDFTGSYSCDASASSESESTAMSPPYTGSHCPVTIIGRRCQLQKSVGNEPEAVSAGLSSQDDGMSSSAGPTSVEGQHSSDESDLHF